MRIIVALLLLAGGCRQVFGIDEVTGADGGGGDVPLAVELRHATLASSETGEPVITLSSLGQDGYAALTVDDAPVTVDDENRASLELAPGLHRIRVTSRDEIREYQTAARTVKVPADRLGRDGTAKLAGHIEITTDGHRYYELVTTGSFGFSPLVDATDTSTLVDLTTMLPLFRPLLTLDGTAGDRAILLELDADRIATARGIYAVDTNDSDTITLSPAKVEALARSRCASVIADTAAERARIDAAGVTASNSPRWLITAQPVPSLAVFQRGVGPVIAAAPDADENISRTVTFADALPGWEPWAVMLTYGVRQETIGTQNYGTLVASLVGRRLTGSCASGVATALPSGDVALPLHIRIGGAEVTQTAQVVTIDRSAPTIDISWDIDAGAADIYEVSVIDYDAPAESPVFVTTSTHAAIPASAFVDGHATQITIGGRRGVPGAATGDFVTLSALHSISRNTTFVFLPGS